MAMNEASGAFAPNFGPILAAVLHRVSHFAQQLRIDRCPVQIDNSSNTAHGSNSCILGGQSNQRNSRFMIRLVTTTVNGFPDF